MSKRNFSLSLFGGLFVLACAPLSADALIAVTYDPTLQVEHASVVMYNGNLDNPFFAPPPIVINGADLTEATSSWMIAQLEPWSDDTPLGAYVLARIDPATGYLEGGTPQLGVNYAVAPEGFSATATSSDTVTFDMPLLGDPATPSGTYEILQLEKPLYKDVYDPDTGEYLDTEVFTDADLGLYLAGDQNFFDSVSANVLTGTPIQFTYNAGAAPQQGCQQDCESNVLFIPGIEGSRLYVKKSDGTGQQIWEPAWYSNQNDAQKLYLNPDGTSINDVYAKAGEVVDTTGANIDGFKVDQTDIYSSFLGQLMQMKASSTIMDYLAFPYDWRMSPEDVVNDGTSYDDGTHYIDQALIALAATSKSGKVTIVAHSNGGLVAKALMEKLQQEGKTNLVDKVIFVDVPQTGTPQAIVGMLHGDGEAFDLPFLPGAIVSQATARGLGENMPDAYDLLPSNDYFAHVATPVVDLTLAPDLRSGSGVGDRIDNSTDLAKFLTTGRAHPAASDIETPDLLSASLLSAAGALHSDLDSWTPPDGVQVIQIAGWGLDTVAGVAYQEEQTTDCSTFPCITATTTRHAPLFTEDGDNTVVTPSQTAMSVEPTYYINLTDDKGFGHANITAMPAFENLFALLVASSSPTTLPAYVTTAQPSPTAAGNSIRLRTLSPVTLNAYDSQGHHTGMSPNPYPSSDLDFVEEQIPGSYYEQYGEGQYIGLPVDGDYKVVMNGTDNGTFTFEITPVDGGVAQPTISYADIPVTASTTATVDISASNPAAATLALDLNGDGKVDETLASSSEATDPLAYTKLIRSTVDSMNVGKTVELQLDAKLTNVGFLIARLDKWDSDDSDNDEAQMHGAGLLRSKLDKWFDNKFAPAINNLIIQKLDKMETYVQQQLQPPQPQRGVLGVFLSFLQKNRGEQNDSNEQISADQAAAIINMIERLKVLIN